MVLRVLNFTWGGLVLCLGIFNAYNYLYKQKKYKMTGYVTLYWAALTCICCDITYSAMVPYTNYCNNWYKVLIQSSTFCNLIVGVC